ncbi:hypothetical protein SCHPADRAFT_247442 [Schizopora paradoxa]|uniref:Uncharacterized protein n=1 Tax=Schizopora paradoxa TaxID=27342 RepID=A0A0H2SF70_9AGAM|nr:hypothetical protein SCHPADRAFT_247442 [Schizopora paradoxa]
MDTVYRRVTPKLLPSPIVQTNRKKRLFEIGKDGEEIAKCEIEMLEKSASFEYNFVGRSGGESERGKGAVTRAFRPLSASCSPSCSSSPPLFSTSSTALGPHSSSSSSLPSTLLPSP